MIIEDDRALSNGIAIALKGAGIEIAQCFDLAGANMQILKKAFDLLILDVNLPDGNGLSFLQAMRKTQSVPVILLTANDMETDIVTGLEMGADDYITKPFSLAVLRARVNTQLKEKSLQNINCYRQDDFVFDFDKMEFFKSGESIEFSKTEQKLLKILIDNKGRTLERAALVDRIWTDGAKYVDENALSVTVKRLRDKLESTPNKPTYIKTIYGIGYSWVG